MTSQNNGLRTFAAESISRHRKSIVQELLRGFCGGLAAALMKDATELLFAIIHSSPLTEIEQHLVDALRQEFFVLGEEARQVTLNFLMRFTTETDTVVLGLFFESFWEMHQVEDLDELLGSDVVAHFTLQFS